MRFLVAALALCAACRATAPGARFPATAQAIQPVPAIPSPGCRAPKPVLGARRLTSRGRTRRFLLVAPDKLEGPAPLVLNFHGVVESPELQQLLSGMDAEARKRGMIVAYPQGVGTSWNAGVCCGRARDEGVDDVRFVRDLVHELTQELCIDESRIFATGMSNGAMFSYRLACEASDLIAAIAPVAGVEAVPSCKPRRPVPVLAFNGTWDPLVRYSGGWLAMPGAVETIARWNQRDGCSPPSRVAYQRGDTRCETATGCDVVLCTTTHGGHTWPGGMVAPFLGHTTSDIDATCTMLDFFLDHPMPVVAARPNWHGVTPRARPPAL